MITTCVANKGLVICTKIVHLTKCQLGKLIYVIGFQKRMPIESRFPVITHNRYVNIVDDPREIRSKHRERDRSSQTLCVCSGCEKEREKERDITLGFP